MFSIFKCGLIHFIFFSFSYSYPAVNAFFGNFLPTDYDGLIFHFSQRFRPTVFLLFLLRLNAFWGASLLTATFRDALAQLQHSQLFQLKRFVHSPIYVKRFDLIALLSN